MPLDPFGPVPDSITADRVATVRVGERAEEHVDRRAPLLDSGHVRDDSTHAAVHRQAAFGGTT